MKTYTKPEILFESLSIEENIASVIPTVTDEENDEVEISNAWGDDQYWDQ